MNKKLDIQDSIFETDIALEKARFTADIVVEQIGSFQQMALAVGLKCDELATGVTIISDYLDIVQENLKKLKEKVENMDEQSIEREQ